MFHKSSTAAILTTVALAQFLVSLDLSVMNVGLPRIQAALQFGPAALSWVIHAYALAFGGLLLLGGRLADRYGRRRLLLIGLTLFAAASLLGGFAATPAHLVAARAAQGIGAAMLAPAALALLTSTFPSGKARVRAFGVWSATNAAGGAAGVLVGGLLTEYAGWQWVMWVNVPMALLTMLLAWKGMEDDGTHSGGRADVLGAVLVTAGMALTVFAVVRTEVVGWASLATLGCLGAAVVLLVLFVRVEQTTSREPIVRLEVLTNRSVAGANLANLMIGGAMASAFYFMTLYLQEVLGHGAARAGVEFLPFALGVVAGSVLAIKLGYRLPARTLLIGGAIVSAAGFAWFSLIDANGTFAADVLGPSLVASVGFGLCLGPVVSTATIGVPASQSGAASALLNASRQIGASLGLAVLGTASLARINGSTSASALASGYSLGLALAAGLLLIAAVFTATVVPRSSTSTPERSVLS
ncbi:MFS transporter [Thermobifida alba]|uniref:MFS transporter n=1 Tax=Thermobifida alba TaxID=53522 RepID=A0ABY4KX95_THEAE|nr:MFS transporter [Thermobifida alba]UPT20066.1 MFS transporter [Thermobifida alba]